MNNIDIVKVVMVREASLMHERTFISNGEDAARVVRHYLEGADREHFVVLMLDTKHVVNAIHTVSVGTLDASLVHPREVFKAAILANASAIIAAHNHPSGSSDPSPEDISITRHLLDASKLVGIDLLDHIVLGDPGFVSFQSLGYL